MRQQKRYLNTVNNMFLNSDGLEVLREDMNALESRNHAYLEKIKKQLCERPYKDILALHIKTAM